MQTPPIRLATVAAIALLPTAASANEPGLGAEEGAARPTDPIAASPPADRIPRPADSTLPLRDVVRPWLYATDPSPPPPMHVVATLGVGYARVDRGAARPFAADLAHAGAVFSAGAQAGLARVLSAEVEGLLAGQGDSTMAAGVMTGLSLHPWDATNPVDVGVSAGYLRELGGGNGAWGRVGIAGDLGRLRLAATALGEHVFEPGRDGVDVLVTTGASYSLTRWARVGAEYVVQDLEGAWDPEEADGGIRHFVGASVGVEPTARVRLLAGPALGLSEGSPRILGRLAAIYVF